MPNIHDIAQTILDISHKHKLSHLGSCFSMLPILFEIYSNNPDDIIILSNGHAGLAQYACLQHFHGFKAEALFLIHGIHPCYDPCNKLYCTTGSLGMGIAVAAGYALTGEQTHVIISDGECAEGSVWETLAFLQEHALSIEVHVNMNGYGACKSINKKYLKDRLVAFYPSIHIHETSNDPFPDALQSHYLNLAEEDYEKYSSIISLRRDEEERQHLHFNI